MDRHLSAFDRRQNTDHARRNFGSCAQHHLPVAHRFTEPPNVIAGFDRATDFNPAIGQLRVLREGSRVRFDFGEWASEVATRVQPDDSLSMVTTVPGFNELEFLIGRREGKRTLTLRDAQHSYVMVEQ